MTEVIKVVDFTRFPGPRYRRLGEFSGEEYREDILVPAIKRVGKSLVVDLDSTMGYGSSFLEEAFGGLIRDSGLEADIVSSIVKNIISDEDPSLIDEITSYVKDAIAEKQDGSD